MGRITLRWLVVVAVVMMAAGAITACGGADDAGTVAESEPEPVLEPEPEPPPEPEPEPEGVVTEEGWVLVLDRVGRSSDWPSEVELSGPSTERPEPPAPGNEFLFAIVTVAEAGQGHITSPIGEDSAVLLPEGPDQDQKYFSVAGVTLRNPMGPLTGPSEIKEGAQFEIVFELPEDRDPDAIRLHYAYFEGWDNGEQEGVEPRTVDIPLR